MVLLDMLIKENKDIVIAHVNYQIRNDSYLDAKTIKKYIENKNKVIFEEKIVNPEEYTNANFEAEARLIRYAFFVDLYKKYKADAIYIAHHRDDYIETYLFKKQRSGLYDYYGIKERTYYGDALIIRPLINWYKEDIIEYSFNNNIIYHEDSTNLKLNYSRNIIRSKINKLSKEEKNLLYQEAQLLNDKINKEKNNIERYKDKAYIKIEDFNKLGINEKRRLLFHHIKKYDISIKYVDELIKKIIYSNNFKQDFLNTSIAKAYDILYIIKNKCHEYKYEINNEKEAIFFVNLVKNSYNCDIILSMDNYPYSIRNYQMDDFDNLGINYQSYRNKLKKDKVPFFLRDMMPVIEKDNKIASFIKYKR